MATVQREDRGSKGSFYIELDGQRVGELTFTTAGPTVIIDHTEVGDALRGQGAGKSMVEAAVAWARAEHKKIMPLCPFAKSVFDKEPTLRDVLA
jgi:hypothetical protein